MTKHRQVGSGGRRTAVNQRVHLPVMTIQMMKGQVSSRLFGSISLNVRKEYSGIPRKSGQPPSSEWKQSAPPPRMGGMGGQPPMARVPPPPPNTGKNGQGGSSSSYRELSSF